MFHWFYKTFPTNTFLYFVNENFAHQKKHVISTPTCLSLLFQEKYRFIYGIYRNLNAHLKGGINKQKWGTWVAIFPNDWYSPPSLLPTWNKVTQSNIKNFRLRLERTGYLHLNFSGLAFSHFYYALQKKIEPRKRKYLI